jgi:hypothetical protein
LGSTLKEYGWGKDAVIKWDKKIKKPKKGFQFLLIQQPCPLPPDPSQQDLAQP